MTEYINDINRENTEVLAEYGADEKVRQAYTYGESGIGERVSVDKSEESSYYLYDGRNSVTGILTETANLTNSYQYIHTVTLHQEQQTVSITTVTMGSPQM